MFERFEKIIGHENLEKIKEKTVMVIGIGGVGSYTVEALVRSGIENIIIIDSDLINITNKNRQIIALDSTIGRKKVDVMKDRVMDINQECKVVALDIFLDITNTKDIILNYKPDYVVDACDTIATKKEIIKTCLDNNISFISCMGTGNKLDPTKLQISDLSKTSYDPLAKILRKWSHDEKIKGKISVLWSSERPIQTHDRIPGSTSFVPSTAGLIIASEVMKKIIKKFSLFD